MQSGSRRTRGKRCRNSSLQLQCVVAVRPSRSPAPASRKEPEHTLATRRARRAQDWMNRRVRRQSSALRVPLPPATMSVPTDPGHPKALACSVAPEELFTAPLEVFARLPGARVVLAAVRGGELAVDCGISFANVQPLSEVRECALLCVPGGFGTSAAMEDRVYLAALRRLAAQARYVTSVCTGSLLLG